MSLLSAADLLRAGWDESQITSLLAELHRLEEKGVSDAWITAKVKSTFAYSRNVDGHEISVDTKNGAVTLKGSADTGAERDLAIELAKNVRGVTSVNAKGLKVG